MSITLSTIEKKEIEFGSACPVIRMLDEREAKAFFMEFLGFEVDWEHRFRDNSPLYMQIKLGLSIIHLDGHADKNFPKSTFRILVKNIEPYHNYLVKTGSKYSKEIELVRPRGTNLEMPIYDPFGNLIIFWERNV